MRLAVVSHKPCWSDPSFPSGYATDGGFPFQMRALSELFDSTTLVVPCLRVSRKDQGTPLEGHDLSVVALVPPSGTGFRRKLSLLPWLTRNGPILLREVRRADAVHTPIPGDIGTIGMLFAFALRKPLFVRHCGNWLVQTTWAERFWKWFMECFAGGRNVMLATGGSDEPPSRRNHNIRWIFSTSLTSEQISRSGMPRQAVSLEAPRLITVCRQEPDKGTDLTIMSLPHLLVEFPGIRLDVVGNGSALKDWIALANSLGVREHVVFHGGVVHSQVLEYLLDAHIFCFPTAASEGFPKAVLEALACGLPVITTPVSVLPQLIGTGCGLVIPERTPNAVAEAVRSLMLNSELYMSMSAQAVETARQYSLERWSETIGRLLSAHWGELRSGDRS